MATEGSVFSPQVEAQVPQRYDEICENEQLKTIEAFTQASTNQGQDEEAAGPISPERRDVHDFGHECFLLQGLLSEEEAKYYIDKGEGIGFGPIHGVKASYRNCERIMVHSPSLADVLWSRARPFLSELNIQDDPHNVHIHGISALLQGKWKPCGINDIFRLCKYAPGGHFAPHFDGHLVKSPTMRSMQTLMLYLNGDFDGGTTNFIDDSQQLYQDNTGRYCAEEKNVICRIKPEPGLAIIFNHHRLHEGQATRNGRKYILRTDILYERVSGPEVSETETAAMLLVQEAERLEGHGECMKAMELYRKAFRMSPSLAEAYGN